jgi:hypothetical protein
LPGKRKLKKKKEKKKKKQTTAAPPQRRVALTIESELKLHLSAHEKPRPCENRRGGEGEGGKKEKKERDLLPRQETNKTSSKSSVIKA